MNDPVFNFVTIIISMMAILISIISILQTHASSSINQRETMEANNISKEANRISLETRRILEREHKEKILPELIIIPNIRLISRNPDYDDVITLSIKNTAHYKAVITEISGFGDFKATKRDGSPIKLPLTLLLNNLITIQLSLSKERKAMYLATPEKLEQRYDDMLSMLLVEIKFLNELEIPYVIYLRFDSNSGLYVGDAVELHK